MNSVGRIFILLVFVAWGAFGFTQRSSHANVNNLISQLLNDIEFTSQIKSEWDDNIFLESEGEDADLHTRFTQGIKQRKSHGNHFWEWGYVGSYDMVHGESEEVLSHRANFLYSYRPFKRFSIGVGNIFNWLEDSKITTAFGDRLLALGYDQVTPFLQTKYELTPTTSLVTDHTFERLDVRDPDTDDFIDHTRFTNRLTVEQILGPQADWVAKAGYQWSSTDFGQAPEKDSLANKGFVGLTKKFPGLFNLSTELGFDNLNFDDNSDQDDNNIESLVLLDTTFSLFTKLTLSYQNNALKPSLRREYSKYASNLASVTLNHMINPKTTVGIGYTFEHQKFDDVDALLGQASRDRNTDIQTVNVGLNRKLNNWLTVETNYSYTRRDTDFSSEDYANNKVSVALTVRY